MIETSYPRVDEEVRKEADRTTTKELVHYDGEPALAKLVDARRRSQHARVRCAWPDGPSDRSVGSGSEATMTASAVAWNSRWCTGRVLFLRRWWSAMT